ncbi:phosphoribosylformylglycinamidine synthase subunit PurS [Rhodothermus marinus]|uniref:Phosphoribosylformylglycinamidine synthase subunit PurS n=1 Tax=Rhodothermus marinus (strain ATCC 43812 / DSM 4252 / R-10) TaxID=518766 RepID=D0MKG4_RHOM4|nr:phosphoribosylformylglycinamidine synthase subunit PurS [Rhodothermus marinus]ACY48876.1 phosphoribosylformylglycinamidine synthase, purS [Rhodothermus marinus DSM 4252]
MFKAIVTVRLRPSILDPQGKAVLHALQNLGYEAVTQVRIGKVIDLWIEADTADEAERIAREAAEKLLANPVMEDFDVTVTPVETPAAAG